MNLLHKEIEKKISYFLNEGIPLENKNFDLAMFYCIPATLVMAVIFFVYRLDKRIAFFSLMLALFMLVMTLNITNEIKRSLQNIIKSISFIRQYFVL